MFTHVLKPSSKTRSTKSACWVLSWIMNLAMQNNIRRFCEMLKTIGRESVCCRASLLYLTLTDNATDKKLRI